MPPYLGYVNNVAVNIGVRVSSLPRTVSLLVTVLWYPGMPPSQHQSPVIKGHPLCRLCAPAGFGKGVGKCRVRHEAELGAGHVTGFHDVLLF